MKEIKVLQLIDSLDVGGAEILAVNIANNLAVEGVQSYICATRKEGALKENINNNVNYFFLKRMKIIDFDVIFKLKKYLKKEKIQIIHSHSTSYFIAVCVKFFYPKIKIIWHNHTGANVNLKGPKLFILKFYSVFFDTIISVNKSLNSWSTQKLNSKNNVFINNFPFFQKTNKNTVLKGENDKRIVCLASFRPEKDHLNLLKAFHSILVHNKNWTLHLIGESKNDTYSKGVYIFIKENKLEERVFTYGVCTDIKNILEQATIGVLSSKSEGLPLSLLEYGFSKLPVVITDVGECGHIVNKINSSFLVPKSDSIALSDAINKVIHLSEKDKKYYGEKFYELVKDEYSYEQFIQKLIKIYLNC
jgi:glycosyltransferase involved in cell wall biosynthesis